MAVAKAMPNKPAQRSGHGGGHHGPPAGEPGSPWPLLLAGALALLGVGVGAPPAFLSHFTVFVLACFVGWQVVWNVAPALHTPLMSVTNAISGIIIIGGMLQVSGAPTSAATILGARRDPARDDQHRGRLPRHPAHAQDVPQVRF